MFRPKWDIADVLKYTKKNCCTISSVYMRSHFTIDHFILKCNLGQMWAKVFVVQEIFV